MVQAVLIVDHGSRRVRAHEELMVAAAGLSRVLEQRGDVRIVEIAHMEIAEPSIETGIGRCVERGASHIKIVPFFFSRGRHLSEDVPQLIDEASRSFPGVQISLSPPLLELSGFIEMLADHVQEESSA